MTFKLLDLIFHRGFRNDLMAVPDTIADLVSDGMTKDELHDAIGLILRLTVRVRPDEKALLSTLEPPLLAVRSR